MTSTADVVIVGGGLGGLSAAASLSRAGRGVVLLERQDGPGGCAHAFRRNGYLFDPAVHLTGQAFPGQFFDVYLKVLGVRGEVEFAILPESYGIAFPDLRAELPGGFEGLVRGYGDLFPSDAKGIRTFMELSRQVTVESQQVPPRVELKDLNEAIARLPALFSNRNTVLSDALATHVSDPHARAALGVTWPYLGLPPSRVALIDFAANLIGAFEPGPVYVKGSFQKLADALALAVARAGGEIRYGTTVAGINVAGGRVTGVRLEDGSVIEASTVISNADARSTFIRLVGEEHLPDSFLTRLKRLRPSLSGFVVYSATSAPLPKNASHEIFIYDHWDHDATWADIQEGRPGGTWVSIPTLVDPSLAPEGEHIVILSSLARYDRDWPAGRDRFTELMLALGERVLPGYRGGLTHMEVATPLTLARFTGADQGALYGWENNPRQTVPRRLAPKTPIEGLWLVGHWTHPGSGAIRATYSGAMAAMMVLGLESPGQLFGRLAGPAGLPASGTPKD